MIANARIRSIEKVYEALMRQEYEIGGHGFYLSLGRNHGLWSLLSNSARDLAREMGARAIGQYGTGFCPEFDTKQELINWFIEALKRGLIPEELMNVILEEE